MRTHPIVTLVLVGGAVTALVLSAYIGMPLVITAALLVAVGVVGLLLWRYWLRGTSISQRSAVWAGRMGLVAVALAGVVTMLVIQLIPYGRSHSNPPVTGEPRWADDRTRELVVDACYSCHSNEVEYPAYASIAPISWMLQDHVTAARDEVNFSEFATDPGDADESVEVVEEGEMPPPYFTRFGLHPEASLTDAERQELVDGLRRTPGLSDR